MKRRDRAAVAKDIRRLLVQCEDIAQNVDMQRRIRELQRQVAEKGIYPQTKSELMDELQELKIALRHDSAATAEIHLKRVTVLFAQRPKSERRKRFMSLIERIKGAMTGRKRDEQNEIINAKAEKAKKDVEVLEKKIAEMLDKKARLLRESQELLVECSKLDKASAQFGMLRRKWQQLQPKIKMIDQQIARYDKALQNNTSFLAMLEEGRNIKELQQLQTELPMMETILSSIADQADAMTTEMNAAGESLSVFEQKLAETSNVQLNYDEDAFDVLVAQAVQNVAQAETMTGTSEVSSVSSPVHAEESVDPFDALVAEAAARQADALKDSTPELADNTREE